jgi:N-acetylglucosaminyl-diphospho-decaprenol L-rhamnosyltransferase
MKSHFKFSLSVVSHGQGALIRSLLQDLCRDQAQRGRQHEVLLTLNIPEDESFVDDFTDQLSLRVIRNMKPKGFGANHNAAFEASSGEVFVVLNPDIRLQAFPDDLIAASLTDMTGAWAPLVRSSTGSVEDSFRRFPTVARLLRRTILRRRYPDYLAEDKPIDVDWVAGMFIAFRRRTYADLKGFDERYFMYMEDVDICHRLNRRGLSVVLDPRASVVHDAQRASRRSWQHRKWHLRSAVRYLIGI